MNAYRLILTDGSTEKTLAVLAEHRELAAYRLATQCGKSPLPAWSAAWLADDGRSDTDAWALLAWQQWLDDWAVEEPANRYDMLARVEQHAPDIVVEPVQVAESIYAPTTICRSLALGTLHSIAELVMAELAGMLANWHDQIRYRPELWFTEQETALNPAFAVEHHTESAHRSRAVAPNILGFLPPTETTTTASTLIHTFESESMLTEFLGRWNHLQDDGNPIDGKLIGLTTYQRPVEIAEHWLLAPADTPYLRSLAYAFSRAH